MAVAIGPKLCFDALMHSPPERIGYIHHLRVMVSALQMDAYDVLGRAVPPESARHALKDQIDLLAEVLRVWSMVESDEHTPSDRPLDLRAITWLARGRHPGAFLGEAPNPVRTHVRLNELLDLLDLVLFWAAGDQQSVRIEVRDDPPTIQVCALRPGARTDMPPDWQVERAANSLATACRIDLVLEPESRTASLQFPPPQDDFDS